jgi:hypothetical protein
MQGIRYALLVCATLVFWANSNAASRQLFNGEDLSGWRHVGFGEFVVENGNLRPVGGVGILWFEREKIADTILRVVFKVESVEDNSGVFVRIPAPPDDPWMPINRGLEIQINEAGKSAYHATGAIYTFTEAVAGVTRVGGWNTMDIVLEAARTRVYINGVLVSAYRDGERIPPRQNDWDPQPGPRPASGYIGLQNHPQGKTVYFREISLRPIEELAAD